jgi:hypothetical protein
LITVPAAWFASHNGWLTLRKLRRRLAKVDVSLDLLVFSQAVLRAFQHWQNQLIGQACREGLLLAGAW